MIRSVLQLGNPLLRVPARAVSIGDDVPANELITDLLDTVAATKGVGIAAPQIGVLLQIIVIASGPNARYPDAPTVGPFAIINPIIQWLSDETEKDWEGCLSIPGIRGLVTRSKQIRVLGGIFPSHKPVIMEYEGFAARVFQHEIDHLQGKLFIDRVESTLDLVTEQEYARIRLESGGTK
jgi:peptide deformylase